MIIDYDHNQNLNTDRKLDSLKESVQMALNEVQTSLINLMVKPKAKEIIGLMDFFYPIGSYYETSDSTFDPNVSWGGTWVEDTAGRVTVAQDTSDADFSSIGHTDGEKTHTLNVDEMPSHNHDVTYAQYNRGTGSATASALQYTGSTKATSDTGGGQAHNNLQPYIVVKRWHRTA